MGEIVTLESECSFCSDPGKAQLYVAPEELLKNQLHFDALFVPQVKLHGALVGLWAEKGWETPRMGQDSLLCPPWLQPRPCAEVRPARASWERAPLNRTVKNVLVCVFGARLLVNLWLFCIVASTQGVREGG